MIVRNVTRNVEIATHAGVANTWLARAVGLLRHSSLASGEGLIIRPCNSVHTFFMRFPIDVLFVDKQGKIKHAVPSMKPYRASRIVFGGDYVVELPAGTMEDTGTTIGDTVSLEEPERD